MGLQVRIFIVVALLVLEFFRLPLFAVMGIRSLGPILHVLVFLSPLLLYKKFSLSFKGFGPFVLLTVWSLVSSILLLAKGLAPGVYLAMIAPITAPFLFLLLIVVFANDLPSWEKVARLVLRIGFFSGSLYLFLEWLLISKFHVISQCDWASFLGGSYDAQYCDTNRYMLFGFFVYKDMSLAIIMGGFLSFSNWREKFWTCARVLLMIFSLFAVDSLVLSGVFLVLLGVRFRKQLKGNLLLPAFLFLSLLNMFLYTRSFRRLRDYLVNELNLHNFIPSTGGCSRENWFFTLDGTSQFCHSKEVHSLFYMFKFGVLATLSWYFSFLIVTVLFCWDWFKDRPVTTLMYFPLVFILNAAHYSGAESWGVNFICFLVFYIYLKERNPVPDKGSLAYAG